MACRIWNRIKKKKAGKLALDKLLNSLVFKQALTEIQYRRYERYLESIQQDDFLPADGEKTRRGDE